MPGLSQLKQFNNDILSLGDEFTIRAGRGEKPVRVDIPKGIPDKDDSEDFVLGMPEIAAVVDDSAVDDDLSDITGIASPKAGSDSSSAAAPSFEAPDLSSLLNAAPVIDNSSADLMPDLSQFMEPEEEEIIEEEPEPEEISVADMSFEDLLSGAGFDGSEGAEEEQTPEPEETPADDFADLDVMEAEPEPVPEPKPLPKKAGDALSLDEIMGASTSAEPEPEPIEEVMDLPEENLEPLADLDEPADFDMAEPLDLPEEPVSDLEDSAADFDAPVSDLEDSAADFDAPAADLEEPLADLDEPIADLASDIEEPASPADDFSQPLDSPGSLDDMDAPSSDLDFSDSELPDMSLDMPDDFGGQDNASAPDYEEDITTDGDFSIEEDGEEINSDEPLETFDTTGMDDDIDFGIKDTDSQLSGDGSDFQMGNADDIALEGSDFEIPGYSDVSSLKEPKKGSEKKNQKVENLDEPDFSGAVEGDTIPSNALSDEQYKKFLKNLSEYPLNVRLAFENLIVQDEFTDDAEFEIIEKILNKAPARSVASLLEKMLDTSIPVPRDFEHRTAEEYEAYKKSISYQLKNRIIPGFLLGLVLVFFGWALFNFGKYCVVYPIKASSLYKQGYELLMADEYPQSEQYFNEAAEYKMKRNWFFKYARGYRDKKQYQRAERIYKYILKYFNHDKEGGLEYALMELEDLADYPKAEEVVRREVLDWHIQDKDGLLLLGDVFLEWGTEQDPEKLEEAKEQYNNFYQLYGSSNEINSRFMKYFIRTDNLAQVLVYKAMFEPKEKNLSSDDWTELSGYLLEKLYGELPPSEEYLREKIEGVRALLQRAVTTNPENPIALYNIGKYYVHTNETTRVEAALQAAIEKFNQASHIKLRDIYKYIDSYRLLGENYVKTQDYLRAQEQYTNGISLYTKEKENAAFKGNEQIGHLYADLGNINYFIAGDYSAAQTNYQNAIDLNYDNSKIRYRMGYIQYKDKNYLSALGSFIKSGEGITKENNLLMAMGNTLSLRNDDMAAEGYYEQLIERLKNSMDEYGGGLFAQSGKNETQLVKDYMMATNNFGVNLYKIAKRTGDSSRNAQSIVQLQESLRAWDSLSRNQVTMVRKEGSNLAEENIKYITHPLVEFEPAIYLDIPLTLYDEEDINF